MSANPTLEKLRLPIYVLLNTGVYPLHAAVSPFDALPVAAFGLCLWSSLSTRLFGFCSGCGQFGVSDMSQMVGFHLVHLRQSAQKSKRRRPSFEAHPNEMFFVLFVILQAPSKRVED